MTGRAHPWPTPAGAGNAGIAPVRFGADGTVRWSLQMPARIAWYLVAARDGRWAAGGHMLIAGGDRREVRWTRHEPASAPALLDDDSSLAVARGAQGLAALDLANGRERWTRDGVYAVCAPCARNTIAAVAVNGRACSLVLMDDRGAARWSRAVDHPVGVPLSYGDAVVHASKQRIDAFGAEGDPLWHATPGGFATPPPPPTDAFSTQPVAVDDRRVAIGVNAADWRGYMLIDPAARAAAPWRLPNGAHVIDDRPTAVRRVAGRPLAIVTRHLFHMCVTAVDGSEVVQVEMPSEPYAYAVDATGAIAVGYTLEVDYYDKYAWHDDKRPLRGRCGLALFDAAGRRQWTWDAPGPLGAFAVGADGEILVTSEGRLWAIG